MPAAADAAASHREELSALATLATADLVVSWPELDDAETVRDTLLDVVPGLLDVYASMAATLAADWYEFLREDARAPGEFTPHVPDLGDLGSEALVRWGVDPLFAPEPDSTAAQSLVEGGMTKRIANASRDVIMGATLDDPAAQGWQRIARPGACYFCQMLAGRGAIYTEASVDFASHDDCLCGVVPAWGGQPQPVKPYTPSQRNVSDADRARVRAYISEHF